MVDEIKICQAQWNLFFKFCPQFNLKRYIGHRKPAIIFLPTYFYGFQCVTPNDDILLTIFTQYVILEISFFIW